MKKERRKFLKYLLVGSGAFVLGRIFGFDLGRLFSDSKDKKKEVNFRNFKIVETNQELSFYERGLLKDEEILIIDKGGLGE